MSLNQPCKPLNLKLQFWNSNFQFWKSRIRPHHSNDEVVAREHISTIQYLCRALLIAREIKSPLKLTQFLFAHSSSDQVFAQVYIKTIQYFCRPCRPFERPKVRLSKNLVSSNIWRTLSCAYLYSHILLSILRHCLNFIKEIKG